MDPDAWLRLRDLLEQMLRFSDDGLRAIRQQDADVLWRSFEQQRGILQEADRIRREQEPPRR